MLKLCVHVVAENKFSSIGPIYYEYGSMVITYEDSNKAVRALYCLRESRYEDKHLLGKYDFVFYWFEITLETVRRNFCSFVNNLCAALHYTFF